MDIPHREADRRSIHVLEHELCSLEHREQTTVKLEPICDEQLSIDIMNSNKLYLVEENLPHSEITASTVQLPEDNVYSIMPPQFIKLESLLNENEGAPDLVTGPCVSFVLDSEKKLFQMSGETSFPAKQNELVSGADGAMLRLLETAPETRFKCDKCDRTFFFRAHLHRHDRESHQEIENKMKCDQCDKKFCSLKTLNRHRRLHRLGVDVTKCGLCDKVMSSLKSLKRHQMTHTNERPFKCRSCGEGFNTNDELQKHEYRHSSQQFKCIECNLTFMGPHLLKRHIWYTHENSDLTHKCPQCPKVYKKKYSLKHHMQRHEGVQPIFKCEECGRTFFKRMLLRSHLLSVHASEKPYTCQDCGKSYATCALLKQHASQIHSDVKKIKQFKCFDCGKAFIDKMRLAEHMNMHNGIKPFTCEVCGKSFTRENNLSQHVVIHSDVKPFKCTRCDKAFSWKSHLTTHLKSHTGEKPHQCEQCDKCFTERSGLRLHMRSIHNTELPYKNRSIAEISPS